MPIRFDLDRTTPARYLLPISFSSNYQINLSMPVRTGERLKFLPVRFLVFGAVASHILPREDSFRREGCFEVGGHENFPATTQALRVPMLNQSRKYLGKLQSMGAYTASNLNDRDDGMRVSRWADPIHSRCFAAEC